MTLLLLGRATDEPPLRDPADKARVWYQALFKYYQPAKARLTPEQAAALIVANWHRTWKDIKQNGVE